jgi:hypothetical protein
MRTTNPPTTVRLLTRTDVAERLGVSTKTVDRLPLCASTRATWKI